MNTKPKSPTDLQKSGKKFWRTVTDTYILDGPNLELLHRAARQLDIAEDAGRILREDGLVSVNRYGAKQAHPLIAVEAAATSQFRLICKQLHITEMEGE